MNRRLAFTIGVISLFAFMSSATGAVPPPLWAAVPFSVVVLLLSFLVVNDA